MLCKIADADVVTDDLTWQPIGSSGSAGPIAQRPHASAMPSAAPVRPPAVTPTGVEQETDKAALELRIADLETRRKIELEQAHQAGLDQGLRQGRQEAASEMESALDRLAKSIQEVAQVKRKIRGEAEDELVKLSLAVARRILHRELTTDPQSLRGLVYAALQRLQNREVTRVRVFPAGVPAVRQALERNGGLAAIEIIGDGHLQPGALLIETSVGELDASVETQLQEIERGFADRLQLQGKNMNA